MLQKILVFAASTSKKSINKQLAVLVANELLNVESLLIDLNDYELPLYSVDTEKESGIPKNAIRFYELIKGCDAIVVSLAEHNGLHTAVFKNLWDWLSRVPKDKPMNIWDDKPMFLMSASPSKGRSKKENNVLKVSRELFPHFGAKIIAEFYLPSFNHFFEEGSIVNADYLNTFNEQKNKFQIHLNSL